MADTAFGGLVWDIEARDTAAQAAAGETAGGKAGWLEGADLGYVLVRAGEVVNRTYVHVYVICVLHFSGS